MKAELSAPKEKFRTPGTCCGFACMFLSGVVSDNIYDSLSFRWFSKLAQIGSVSFGLVVSRSSELGFV